MIKKLKKIFRIKVKEPDGYIAYDNKKFLLKKNIEHQHIGGKIAYLDRYITLDDICERYNSIAFYNFMKRRPDLFENVDSFGIPYYNLSKPEAEYHKYYYVKIWNNPKHLRGEYAWLGYVIADDEIDKFYMKADIND